MITSKMFSIGQHRRVDSLPRSFQISKPKVSLKHSLDIASPSLSSSSSKTKRSILVGSRYRDQSRSSSTRRQIFANEPIRNKDGSITLSSAFGSVPAIRLEVCCPTFFFFLNQTVRLMRICFVSIHFRPAMMMRIMTIVWNIDSRFDCEPANPNISSNCYS